MAGGGNGWEWKWNAIFLNIGVRHEKVSKFWRKFYLKQKIVQCYVNQTFFGKDI